jgi:hypothetical protein
MFFVGTYEGQTDVTFCLVTSLFLYKKSNFRFMDGISSESSCQSGNDDSE